jgi:ABC-type antimicrobial peptide transport system permease subunit
VFAAIAGTLAAVGIYGVMSYAVTARTQEIGVRIALGAERNQVLWLVLGQVLRLTAIGIAVGIVAVLAGGGALRRVLFEVRPSDPLTIAIVALLLGSVAVIAGWLPAWRASRVDAVEALRTE